MKTLQSKLTVQAFIGVSMSMKKLKIKRSTKENFNNLLKILKLLMQVSIFILTLINLLDKGRQIDTREHNQNNSGGRRFSVEEEGYQEIRNGEDIATIYDTITLKDIELEIGKGEFVAILGDTRSGKSSILSSIIGEMLYVNDETIQEYKNNEIYKPEKDEEDKAKLYLLALNNKNYEQFTESRKNQDQVPVIHVSGSVSYAQQNPWILNQTVRNNILFGEKQDEVRYYRTVKSCQLLKDFQVFEGGDLTQIGEKGSSLSGGQKARVSMARAVYANKDIILMDDPLSALDAHTKKQMFEQVL